MVFRRKYRRTLPGRPVRVEIGDTVEVGPPRRSDTYSHAFVGTVKAVGRTIVRVEDQDGEIFDVDADNIKPL